ncbi:hypothetical protein APHAL10511_007849 [Amanita phalloides]|nr:hypothetical protein APHAL10511_007849 [Amanita phalloides]
MVKYTVAASVTLLQLAMFAQTSVALPIEYPEELESRAISNPNDQQLAERDGTELEARFHVGLALAGAAAAVAGAAVLHHAFKNKDEAATPTPTLTTPLAPAPTTESARRDLSELGARDREDIAKRYFDDVLDRRNGAPYEQANEKVQTHKHSNDRRDLPDLYTRGWDEYEKRSFDEFEERDWDDYELEARGLDFDELD